MSIQSVCKECGTGAILGEGIPVKLICQQCGSVEVMLPKDCEISDHNREERIFILKMKVLAIGDEGNKPPIEKKIGFSKKPAKKKPAKRRVIKRK